MLHLRGVEHPAGHRDGRLAGDELGWAERPRRGIRPPGPGSAPRSSLCGMAAHFGEEAPRYQCTRGRRSSPSSRVEAAGASPASAGPWPRRDTGGGSRWRPRCARRAPDPSPCAAGCAPPVRSTVIWISLEKLNAWPRSSGRSGQLLGQQHVGGRAVLHVEIIANELAVGADHRPLAAQHRADRARHDAVPVQVAAAVEIAAARDAHRQTVGLA